MQNEGTDEQLSIRDYHRRTFHTLAAYARGPETLDWSGQPDPFRRFDGAPLQLLPFRDATLPSPAYADIFRPGAIEAVELNLDSVAALLELSLAISAWKSYGPDSWALRCNPSSGNLHPTEGYIVAAGIEGLADGVHHYRPDEHALEQRATLNLSGRPRLIVGLSSILWREGWKYGERAFRYCQLDIGHAVGALSFAAATLGWRVRMLDHYGSDKTAVLLGLDQAASFEGAEPEEGELLLEIGPSPTPSLTEMELPDEWFALAGQADWQGKANRLDPHPYGSWPLLDAAARVSRFSDSEPRPVVDSVEGRLTTIETDTDAATLIRQRRSAQAFDPRALLPQGDFFRLLDATLPRPGTAPWPANSDAPHTHLLLFVHRVDGLRQGLYALPRSVEGEQLMRDEFRNDFQWDRVTDAPMPLYALIYADCRRAAGTLSCHQPIASDSAFAVSMLGEFDGMLKGDSGYRRLLIEAGMIGQAFYLEAEATGARGTGIGCYFDDAVHDTLGLTGSTLQSIYHFTVGTPLVDERIQTLPPYARLKNRSA